MTKDELNREWALLEGWNYDAFNFEWHCCGPDHRDYEFVFEKVHDYTEPNRFFAEVVPRMWDLNLRYEIKRCRRNELSVIWFSEISVCRNKYKPRQVISYNDFYPNTNPCEAGLEAAIKARKELGV